MFTNKRLRLGIFDIGGSFIQSSASVYFCDRGAALSVVDGYLGCYNNVHKTFCHIKEVILWMRQTKWYATD